ncbi:hypothetical protein ACUXST_000225 [Sphingomonas sp. F9_3S_D5_B_2]
MARLPALFIGCLLLTGATVPQLSASVFLTGDVDWPGAARIVSLDAGGGEAVTLRGRVATALIGPADVRNAYRVVYVSRSAAVTNMTVRGLQAQVLDACIRAHADVVVVRDTHCVMTGGPQSGGVNMPFGLQITAAKTVLVENSSFEGFRWQAPANRYWNGDGITIEKDVAGVQFRGVQANGNSDAGFDVRPFALLSDVSAADNCRNFRFWSGADAGTLTTGDSLKRGGISSCSGIWLNGSLTGARPQLHIRRLVVRMKRPGTIIEVETGPADIRIDRCDIRAPRGTQMIEFDKGAGDVQLGPGCTLLKQDD